MSGSLFAGQQYIWDHRDSYKAATPTLYITTTDILTGVDTYPDEFCPDGWTIVTSWIFQTSNGAYWPDGWRETLCSK